MHKIGKILLKFVVQRIEMVYNVIDFGAGKRGKMRRKCFLVFLIAVCAAFFLDYIDFDILSREKQLDYENSKEYIVRVEKIAEKIYSMENGTEANGTDGEASASVITQQKQQVQLILTARVLSVDGKKIKKRVNIRLTCPATSADSTETVNPGTLYKQNLRIQCSLEKPNEAANPHCFDYRRYLKSKNVYGIGKISSYEICNKQFSLWEKYVRILICKRFEMEQQLDEKTRGIVTGVLFGDTAWLDEDVYEQFRSNGTAHILAVSGLHVGILYGLYRRFFGKELTPFSIIVLAAMLLTYGELSMWSTSVVRASLMISMQVIGQAADLRYDMLTALSTSGLAMMIRNPYVVLGTDFQMSFLAIGSITFFSKLIPKRVPEGLASAMAVNGGLVLYQAYQFNFLSVTALIANIPVIFLTGFLMPAALAGYVAFFCGMHSLFSFFKGTTEAAARLLVMVNSATAIGGKGGWDCVSPPAALAVFVCVLLLFFASETFWIWKERRVYKKVACCLLMITGVSLGAGIYSYCPVSHAQIVFVNVGQGDCLHIRDGKTNILIDGGGSTRYNIGKKTLKPYLLKNRVSSIDLALVTHEHMDHYQGIKELQKCFPVEKVAVKNTANKKFCAENGLTITTLWPLMIQEDTGQDENHMCSVFRIDYRGSRILVTGDLDEEGERQMLGYYKGTDEMKADILKVGHHGSKTSTCEAFLNAVQPKAAVIQVGKNLYGHPAPETLERLKQRGIKIYRNDKNGAVGVHLEKNKPPKISCMRSDT